MQPPPARSPSSTTARGTCARWRTRSARSAPTVVVTRDRSAVRRADRVVVPGQGSMPACAEAMRRSGVADALREAIARGAPVLGICVGLQILFEEGEEARRGEGARARAGPHRAPPRRGEAPAHRLVAAAARRRATGALRARWTAPTSTSPTPTPRRPTRPASRSSTTHGATYCAALARENLFAVQFHPEKSQQVGLALLERFVRV